MIDALIAQIKANVPALKVVAGAAAFGAARESRPIALPAVYVLRLKEAGAPSEVYGKTDQRVAVTAGVVIAAANVADARGDASGGDVETLRAAIRTALLGFVPAGHDPLQFGEGDLAAFGDGVHWWQDTYTSHYDISN